MKRVYILNGPNINLVGIREPEIYGSTNYQEMVKELKRYAKSLGLKVTIKATNSESKIIDILQANMNRYDYFILNAAAYTHTSIAIRDTILAIKTPVIEVHLSDTDNREEFRKVNYLRDVCVATFKGKGLDSYKEALDYVKGMTSHDGNNK